MQKKIAEKRNYKFKDLTALEGLKLMHEYASLLTLALPQIQNAFETFRNDKETLWSQIKTDLTIGEGPFLELLQIIPRIINSDRLEELCKALLSDAEIDEQKCDETGMCELFKGRPLEVYKALFYAVAHNYPDYLPFVQKPKDTMGNK